MNKSYDVREKTRDERFAFTNIYELDWWSCEATRRFVYGDARLDPSRGTRGNDGIRRNVISRRYLPVPPRSNRPAVHVACLRQSFDDDVAYRLAASRSVTDRSCKKRHERAAKSELCTLVHTPSPLSNLCEINSKS